MSDSGVLKATHEGKLKIGDIELNVAVLENGTRVITQSAVFKAFGRTKRGRSKDDIRVLNRPAFIDAKNLQPFIDGKLDAVLNLIEYRSKNGILIEGYDASILPKLCRVYLDAREDGKLVTQQIPLARASEVLLMSLANVGITALVDEATGYQYEREKDALQVVLQAYINNELLKWQKMFPDAFYYEIFRLKNWGFTVSGINKRPGVIGKWTNELIYKQLPKGILDELKSKTPKSTEGNYTARFFQSLTPDIGHPALTAQIYKVIGLMNISNNWDEFKSHFNKMVDRTNGQMEIDFDSIDKTIEEETKKEKLSDHNDIQTTLNFTSKADDDIEDDADEDTELV
ncbi:MAG: P63C domain-containing protein [Kaistella sp.]|nr:P63C domain-containing protein [Kaistella sp.]